ncbi:calcium/sodium antiporter [Spirochaeta isovalerica]|uniref:Cation:H+ antiporter n=1 Tax=Spirochaeta isovalerica TaxID=150 RepID=A0A841RG78_9SPIO|nr:calcium/sodium antiporter [Spirochaeta isovalerica]MBB6481342.1 cation:H+ antiporter [Spirochaeta isovalerica]
MIGLSFVLILLGFVALISGAEFLVRSSSSLARRFGVSELVIGLTIVAFGTSAPELTVNLFSSLSGANSITLGNILGSNIFNILLILGISSLIYPLEVKKSTTWIEIPLCLLSGLVLLVLANDVFLDKGAANDVSRSDGFILLFFFMIFMAYTFHAMRDDSLQMQQIADAVEIKMTRTVSALLAGLFLLFAGGKLIVDNSVAIAEYFGVSQRIIGLTIISTGTSLPELATSTVAAFRKKTDIAIGNIVGSNIFNVFFILGISAGISPLAIFGDSFNPDLALNLIASILLFLFVFTGGGRKIQRWEGGVFLVLYAGYLVNLLTNPQ